VAFLTLRAFLPFMLVIFFVAGVAVGRCLFIAIVRMAVFARYLDMLVPELVAGLVVFEPDLLPIPIRVTVSACASHFPFMRIIFLMAAVTIRRRVTMLDLGFMTGLALDFLGVGVGALEWKIRPLVIEGLFSDWGDILRSTFVFRMALLAFALLLETSV
jgi:hypothetical protein